MAPISFRVELFHWGGYILIQSFGWYWLSNSNDLTSSLGGHFITICPTNLHIGVKGPVRKTLSVISDNFKRRTNKIENYLPPLIVRKFLQLLNFTNDNTFVPMSKGLYCLCTFSNLFTPCDTISLMKYSLISMCLMCSWKTWFLHRYIEDWLSKYTTTLSFKTLSLWSKPLSYKTSLIASVVAIYSDFAGW